VRGAPCADDDYGVEVEVEVEPSADFDPDDYDTKGDACEAFIALHPGATPTEVAAACDCHYTTARRYIQENES